MAELVNEKIRVGIHAEDGLTRTALASCIRGDLQLTESDIADADVVVVAVETAHANTISSLRQVRSDADPKFLLIVEKQWQVNIGVAVENGVRAVIWRTQFSPVTFVRVVHAVASGGGVLPVSLQGALMAQFQEICRDALTSQDLSASGFSNRELDVLRLLSEGLTLGEIAQKLSYSERTVRNALYAVMKRLNLRNRAHAVSYAVRAGLI